MGHHGVAMGPHDHMCGRLSRLDRVYSCTDYSTQLNAIAHLPYCIQNVNVLMSIRSRTSFCYGIWDPELKPALKVKRAGGLGLRLPMLSVGSQ